jgi:mRNA interferase MazF
MPVIGVMCMQGEVWEVEFMPQRGAEIGKVRPAIVVSSILAGKLPLRIVVPITDWKPEYGQHFWFTQILPNSANGLENQAARMLFK